MISFLWWIVTDIMHAKQDLMCDLFFGLKMCFIVGVDRYKYTFRPYFSTFFIEYHIFQTLLYDRYIIKNVFFS